MKFIAPLQQKFATVWPLLDERTRRIVAANEAMTFGYGGISTVSRASGLSGKASAHGIQDIKNGYCPSERHIRRVGAGRKKITANDPQLLDALNRLIEPETRGDPESPLRWICKSTRALAAQLTRQQHPISYVKVAQLFLKQARFKNLARHRNF